MTDRVRGKVALVTGAGGGIGSAIARLLAGEGATVVLSDLDRSRGERAAESIRTTGARVRFLEHDVTSESSWEKAIADVASNEGPLSILINNAGVGARVGQPFDAIPLDEWRRVMRINLDGVFLGTRTAVAAMKATGGGSIVNIGSVAGLAGSRGGAAYGASKGGVHALTRQAAYSAAIHGYGVRVNAILPSYVWTDLVAERAIREHGSREKALEAFARNNPLGRVNEPEDIAYAALFLASDESRQITGIELVIDGGQMIA